MRCPAGSDGDLSFDDAQVKAIEPGEIGAIRQGGQDGGTALGTDPGQQLGAGASDGPKEAVAVEAAVGEQEHPR